MSVNPGHLDLNGKHGQAPALRCGDTYDHPLTFVDSNGAAIDKSTATFMSQIRPSETSEIIIADFGIAITGAGNNVVTISLDATLTAPLIPGKYVWDLQETIGLTTVTRLAGEAVVESDVSRA